MMWKDSWSVAKVAWKRWITEGKTFFCIALLTLFCVLTYGPLNDIVDYLGIKASCWIFSFFLSNFIMLLVYAGICVLIFSDVMMIDGYAELEIVRVGRLSYVVGQLLFVTLSALFIVMIPFVSSFLVVLPSIHWDMGWGEMFRTIAESAGVISSRTGIEIMFLIESQYLEAVTPLQSTFLTMLLMWLYAVLTALLIGSFRIMTGRNIGIIVAGAIAAFSIFARDMGAMAFGEKVRFFAPLLWSAPIYLNWNGVTVMPTFIYAFSVYSIVIVLLLTVSVIRFQRYDIHDQSTNG